MHCPSDIQRPYMYRLSRNGNLGQYERTAGDKLIIVLYVGANNQRVHLGVCSGERKHRKI